MDFSYGCFKNPIRAGMSGPGDEEKRERQQCRTAQDSDPWGIQEEEHPMSHLQLGLTLSVCFPSIHRNWISVLNIAKKTTGESEIQNFGLRVERLTQVLRSL